MTGLEAFRALVVRLLHGKRYDGLFPATVHRANLDGTIDVLPDDEEFGGSGLSVSVDSDLPNTVISPAQGARCLVGFKGGDPRKPYVSEWQSGGLGIIGLDGGTRGVARFNDPVELCMPPSVTVTGIAEGIQTIPGAPPVIVPIPPTPLVLGVVVVAPPPTAIVQMGRPKLLA